MFKTLNSLFKRSAPIGMEFSDRSVKVVDLTCKGQSLHIHSMHSERLPYGLVDEGRIKDSKSLSHVLHKLVTNLEIHKREVHLVIPSQSILVRLLKFPDVPLKDLRKIVEFEIKHNIHLPFDEPYYDFIKLDRTAQHHLDDDTQSQADSFSAGWKEAASAMEHSNNDPFATEDEAAKTPLTCEVILVAAPMALIEEYSALVRSVGLVPKSVEIKAFSLYRLLVKQELVDTSGTLMVVDLNETVTELSIFHHKQLKLTRNVPLPFTFEEHNVKDTPSTLSQSLDSFAFQTDESDMKADFQTSCNDLAHELERLMNFYRYTLNNRSHEFQKLIISGDIPRFSEVKQFLNDRLNLEIVELKPKQLQYDDQRQVTMNPVSFAVPIGLALRGKAT